jgi:acyl-CoA synthetase (AMP-forming)/AMP-acid ligase II
MAERQPAAPALKVPRGRTPDGRIDYLCLTFAELAAEADAWTARLQAGGVRRGDRTLVMVRPGLPLIASVFGLFQLGAVPVVIDPGMGRKSFLACVARSRPRALVGIPMARLMRHIFRGSFRTVEVTVPASGSLTARLLCEPTTNFQLPTSPAADLAMAAAATDLAAVLFTSGSTGAPKGVCYEHGMFEAQVRLIRETYGIQPGEVDLPMLPIFALFNPALGMTTVVPEIDPGRPAEVDPAKIVQAIQQEGVTNSFGSPTLWGRIFTHCLERNLTLPTLRRVLCAGAPVPAALWKDSHACLPNGQLHSPYGATEALPIATISAAEIQSFPAPVLPAAAAPTFHAIREKSGEAAPPGTCVGCPLPEIAVKIIAISDTPVDSLAEARELPPGEIGEIIVSGPVVTRDYDALPEATALAKIGHRESKIGNVSSSIWHRMGDAGYLDDTGRLWFCGRKAERVVTTEGTLFTEPCEIVFRRHPRVARCALVGLGERGRQEPALVVESPATGAAAEVFARELAALATASPATAGIRKFLFHPSFPVDVRHNAKIHRLVLARWAATAPAFTAS